jgi:hypothetical protein
LDIGVLVFANGGEAPRGTISKVEMVLVDTVINHIDTNTVTAENKGEMD